MKGVAKLGAKWVRVSFCHFKDFHALLKL
jgi:hypothetical protein